VLPSPNVPSDRLERFQAALERASRPIALLKLPVELYEPRGNHLANIRAAADLIIAELDALDAQACRRDL
jgi:hypothetical protein